MEGSDRGLFHALGKRASVSSRGFESLPLRMDLSKARQKIVQDLYSLKDRKGYLRANTTNYDRLFGRDSLIAAWQLLDWNPGICKATLDILANFQGEVFNEDREEEPGKIIHETDIGTEWHPDVPFPFPYYGSVDSTPLFCIIFGLYVEKTNDNKFLMAHWKNLLHAMHWMEEYGDRDGDMFLEYERKNPNGLYHQGWKDSVDDHLRMDSPVAIVEAQGYYYMALNVMSRMAERQGEKELAEEWYGKAEQLKLLFNQAFWMEEEGFYALGLDGRKQQRKAITSNPGLLLFTGIVDDDKVDRMVDRLFQEDLWTKYGIRTHATTEPDFEALSYHLGTIWPHDNWMIAEGLHKVGKEDRYEDVKKGILRALEAIGYQYIPEYYAVREGNIYWTSKAGNPQAWTVGALFNFLGVLPTLQEKVLRQIPTPRFRW